MAYAVDLFRSYVWALAAVLGAWFVISLLWLWQNRRRHRQTKSALNRAVRLLQNIKLSAGLENNLHFLLEIYSDLVEAHGYAFYVLDHSQTRYVLKAVRHRHANLASPEPSYSGLTPFQKEVYQPPMSLPRSGIGTEIGLIKAGEVPLLSIPLAGEIGLIRIGPLKHLPKPLRHKIEFFSGLLPELVNLLVENDRMKLHTDVVVTSEHALHAVSSMALDKEAIQKKTLSLFTSALGIADSLILFQRGQQFVLSVLNGWNGRAEKSIREDRELGAQLWQAIGSRDVAVLNGTDSRFPKLATLAQEQGADKLLLGKLQDGSQIGLLVCRLGAEALSERSEEQWLMSMRTLSTQLTKLLRIQNNLQPMTQNYVELLKLLSRTIDNLNPYTIGYSELMSRYSILIAQDLGLPQREIQDIALAAYLSNIGVLGLSEELTLKEGQFSEIEYEKMKLHADVGAEIIEMLIGNKAAAQYVRYHHERIDGHGYPAGLKGQEIPLGARILAVVQTFLAKINGRAYRQPLSFDQALELLQSSAGTQLDPQVVDVLCKWFQRKRNSMSHSTKALGPCYEMCCTTAEICATCPAYQQPELNCWDLHRNNCQAHGKSCETCFVYTEAMGRRKTSLVAGGR